MKLEIEVKHDKELTEQDYYQTFLKSDIARALSNEIEKQNLLVLNQKKELNLYKEEILRTRTEIHVYTPEQVQRMIQIAKTFKGIVEYPLAKELFDILTT